MTDAVARPAIPDAGADLPERLRRETAACHREVEAVADIAGTVRTRADYVELLLRLYALHDGLERLLAAESWAPGWAGAGVRIAGYRRADQLGADLDALGGTTSSRPISLPSFATFSQALGCLYVLEGSALGGRMVAGIVRAAVGEVPVAFLTGVGRSQAAPWAGVRRALRRFDERGGDGDGVVAGARATFAAFGHHLNRNLPPRARLAGSRCDPQTGGALMTVLPAGS